MNPISEGKHDGEFLARDFDPSYNRENIKVNSGQNLAAGTVLGRILSAGAATAVGSPSGTGVITVGTTFGPAAMPGIYRLVCVAASSGAGTFNLYAPDGSLVRQITVGGGASASDHLTITIADGTPDFAAGDTFSVTVTGGDYEQLNTAGTNGTQIASAILYGAVDASSAVTAGTAEVRGPAIVVASALVWPDGISNAAKFAALAHLNSLGIVAR